METYVVIYEASKEQTFTVSHEYDDEQEAIDNIRLMLRKPDFYLNIRFYKAIKLDISELTPMTMDEINKLT